MPTSNNDFEASLDPIAKKTLEFLKTAPEKGYTVMDIYAGIYSEEEKSAHSKDPSGFREKFREIQGWIDQFCEQGHVRKKIVSASLFYTAAD